MKKYNDPEFMKVSFDVEDIISFGEGEGGDIGWGELDPESPTGDFFPSINW